MHGKSLGDGMTGVVGVPRFQKTMSLLNDYIVLQNSELNCEILSLRNSSALVRLETLS